MALTLPSATFSSLRTRGDLSNIIHLREMVLTFGDLVPNLAEEPIILDATETYSRTSRGKVTDNPVGDKSDRADHYRTYSPEISIEGIISNETIALYEWLQGFTQSESRTHQFIKRLDEIIKRKTMLQVLFPDSEALGYCFITNLSYSRDKNVGGGYRVSMKLKQVQLIKSQIVSVPLDVDLQSLAKINQDSVSTKAKLFKKDSISVIGQVKKWLFD